MRANAYNKLVEFEWSDASAALNLARYDVRFTEAVHVFLDPKAIEFVHSRRETLSLIGHTARCLLYVVFTETADGHLRLLHARLADPAVPEVDPEFDFDPRRMQRIPRPDRHLATPAQVSPRHCHVTLTLELTADVVAAYRNRPAHVNQILREALHQPPPPTNILTPNPQKRTPTVREGM